MKNVDKYRSEVSEIMKNLKENGFGITADESFHIQVSGTGKTGALGFEEGKIEAIEIPSNEDFMSIDVFPIKGVISKVSLSKQWTKYCDTHDDWDILSDKMLVKFAKIVNKFKYEEGSSGGHPPNVDCFKRYGNIEVAFCYWGNPYHI